MNDPASSNASYEYLLNLPENLVGAILVGQLHTSTRPAPKHALQTVATVRHDIRKMLSVATANH